MPREYPVHHCALTAGGAAGGVPGSALGTCGSGSVRGIARGAGNGPVLEAAWLSSIQRFKAHDSGAGVCCAGCDDVLVKACRPPLVSMLGRDDKAATVTCGGVSRMRVAGWPRIPAVVCDHPAAADDSRRTSTRPRCDFGRRFSCTRCEGPVNASESSWQHADRRRMPVPVPGSVSML